MANRSQFVQNKLLTYLLGTISHAFWHTQRFQVGLANNNPWHHKNIEEFCTRIMETYISAIILFGQIYKYIYIYINAYHTWSDPGNFLDLSNLGFGAMDFQGFCGKRRNPPENPIFPDFHTIPKCLISHGNFVSLLENYFEVHHL